MEIFDFGAKRLPTSTNMVPSSAPKATLGEEESPDRTQTVSRDDFESHFGTTWPILDAILGTTGCQGPPKNQAIFSTKSSQNV